MPEELFETLLRFHREVAVADLKREIYKPLNERITALRDEMLTNFDAVFPRLDRLEANISR